MCSHWEKCLFLLQKASARHAVDSQSTMGYVITGHMREKEREREQPFVIPEMECVVLMVRAKQ